MERFATHPCHFPSQVPPPGVQVTDFALSMLVSVLPLNSVSSQLSLEICNKCTSHHSKDYMVFIKRKKRNSLNFANIDASVACL